MAISSLLWAQIAGLRERNEVTVLCVAGPDPGELDSVARLRERGIEVHAAERRNGERGRLRRAARMARGWLLLRHPWRTVWFDDPQLQVLLDGLLETRTFDLLVAEDDAMANLELRGALPAVLTIGELGRARGRATRGPLAALWNLVAWIDWRRWPHYQLTASRRFTLIVVFTEADRERVSVLDRRLGDRVRVAPFGIELPPPSDPALEQEDLLLFAGEYTHPPNVDAALWLATEIMPLIRAARPAARLLLVGRNAPETVRELGSCDGVEFIGVVPALDPLLARAACVMAPLRLGGGMRMKVLHAMACGRAVVTTELGAAGLGAPADLPLAIANDPEQLAALTVSLLGDGAARRDLGRRARVFVAERHSPQAVAARLERIYSEAVELGAGGVL